MLERTTEKKNFLHLAALEFRSNLFCPSGQRHALKGETMPTSSFFGISLRDLFKFGLKELPVATKFILGGTLTFAVAIAILSTKVAFGTVVVAALSVLLISLLLLLLVSFPTRSLLADITAWSLTIMFLAVVALFIISMFTNYFPEGRKAGARLLGAPDLLISEPDTRVMVSNADSLPAGVLDPNLPTDIFDRVQALSLRPSLTVSTELVLPAKSGEKIALYVNTLDLRNGRIITQGGNVTIEAVTIIGNQSAIRAFEESATDTSGTSGGMVKLIVHGSINGNLTVDLSARPGAKGLDGVKGVTGAQGAQGSHAASGLIGCLSGADRGQTGGQGGTGTRGEDGKPGGQGGELLVKARDIHGAKNAISFTSKGGIGGAKGVGGPGGDGGQGGQGGRARGLCQGDGPQGGPGPTGNPGDDGLRGADGASGNVVFAPLSVEFVS